MARMAKPSKPRTLPSRPDATQDTPDFSSSFATKSATDAATDTATDTATEIDSGLHLADHFLIAMPSMLDPVFGGTLVYLCEHNADGALGVIVNKATDMTMDVLFERIDLKLEIAAGAPGAASLDRQAVLFGGPVQVERGFVLHSPQQSFSSMMQVSDAVALTTSKDVLEAVAVGDGPPRLLVTLGCAGWSAGQLEQEIVDNGWLTVRADPAIIFELPIEQRFAAAMKLLGVDPVMLTGAAGHA
jgi:putative transcriptional regulator